MLALSPSLEESKRNARIDKLFGSYARFLRELSSKVSSRFLGARMAPFAWRCEQLLLPACYLAVGVV